MGSDNIKMPNWLWGVIVAIVLGVISFISTRAMESIEENTKAVSELNVTITEVKSSVDLVRSDTQGTLSRLLDVVETMKEQNRDFEQRLRKLEAK